MKMHIIALGTLLCLSPNSVLNKNPENDLERAKLMGEVESVKETSFIAMEKAGSLVKGDRKREGQQETDFVMLYNRKGNLAETLLYFSDESLAGKYIYSYDIQGNKVETKVYFPDGRLASRYTYQYDKEGNMTGAAAYQGDKFYFRDEYKNDKQGNRIEMTVYYSESGPLSRKNLYVYENGNRIEEKRYNDDENISARFTYKFDESGNETQYNEHNSEGKLTFTWTYIYDDSGNRIESKNYDSKRNFLRKNTSRFDKYGNLIDIKNYKSDESLRREIEHRLEYDTKGNWVRKTTLINQVASYIIEREILYY